MPRHLSIYLIFIASFQAGVCAINTAPYKPVWIELCLLVLQETGLLPTYTIISVQVVFVSKLCIWLELKNIEDWIRGPKGMGNCPSDSLNAFWVLVLERCIWCWQHGKNFKVQMINHDPPVRKIFKKMKSFSNTFSCSLQGQAEKQLREQTNNSISALPIVHNHC